MMEDRKKERYGTTYGQQKLNRSSRSLVVEYMGIMVRGSQNLIKSGSWTERNYRYEPEISPGSSSTLVFFTPLQDDWVIAIRSKEICSREHIADAASQAGVQIRGMRYSN